MWQNTFVRVVSEKGCGDHAFRKRVRFLGMHMAKVYGAGIVTDSEPSEPRHATREGPATQPESQPNEPWATCSEFFRKRNIGVAIGTAVWTIVGLALRVAV